MINIEIAYAGINRQIIIPLTVAETCTVKTAIEQSGILQRFPEIDLSQQKIGIYSKPANLETIPQNGDRIEIYRPLLIDPKQARKKRAGGKVFFGSK